MGNKLNSLKAPKAIQPSDETLKAIGYTSKGKRKVYEINIHDGVLLCYDEDLISLEIPEGVKQVKCSNNLLTELNIPKGVKVIICHNNLLTELNIPESVQKISCGNNKITELNITNNIAYLTCDRNVLGLDNIDWEYGIILV